MYNCFQLEMLLEGISLADMEWICKYLELKELKKLANGAGINNITLTPNLSTTDDINGNAFLGINAEPESHTAVTALDYPTATNKDLPDEGNHVDIFEHITLEICVPALCIFGIVGNLLNFIILIKKILEGVDNMERGATVGLIALATSDLGFCTCTLISSFTPHDVIAFQKKTLSFYVALYGNCIINILIKTSTYFTIILAVSRFFAVCFPMKARQYMRCGHTVLAIFLSAIFWICCHIPLTWTWKVEEADCTLYTNNIGKVYILAEGTFQKDKTLMLTMTYVWAILGFFIPVAILGYCNYRLMKSLRISHRLRYFPDSQRTTRSAICDPQRRISITLVWLVVMFFLLVCPSELLHFYGDIGKFYGSR